MTDHRDHGFDMTRPPTSTGDDMPCAAFEARLAAWLEGDLGEEARAAMERHHAGCAECAALVSALDQVVQGAQLLPALTPSRDLWHGIEARLEAPVISLAARRDDGSIGAGHRGLASSQGMRMRWFAAAAAVLVAVSSGITWTVARSGMVNASAVAPSAVAAVTPAPATSGTIPVDASVASPSITSPSIASPSATVSSAPASSAPSASSASVAPAAPARSRTVQVSNRDAESMSDVDAIYEREIASLRRIVNRRLNELDPATVTELRRNLETIDRAILDSRRALQRDPRSGLLSTELDRTLEAKLALMRRVALL